LAKSVYVERAIREEVAQGCCMLCNKRLIVKKSHVK
jgi:hypothetical protein